MGKPRPKLQRTFSTIKRQFTFRKSIRPFISSTFLDFQDERGHLQRYVFPQLNSVCHSRGTFFAPADLRWGINNEQCSSGNVISLCLEYINRCSPFFICLLGERYGTHRPEDAPLLPSSLEKLPRNMSWLDRNYLIAASKGHEWIMQEAYQYCSVTELEIIQAAILNDSKYCRFYVRDVRHIEDKFLELPEKEREEKLKMYMAENEETEMRVTALKQKLINKGLKIQFYRTPEELGQKVLDDWMEIINELYPPLDELLGDVDGEQFREWAAHEAYAETRRRVFVLTPEIQKLFTKMTDHCEEWMDPTTPSTAEKVDEWVVVKGKKKKMENLPGSKSIVTLIGERGCGKTSLVANWVKQFQASHPDVKVRAHYVGSSALSTDICSFLRRVTFDLRGEFGGDSPAESNGDSEELSNFHRICEAFVAAIAMGPCVMVLDAVDELGSTMGMGVHQVKEMKWLPAVLPPHCKIIITTVRSDLTYKSLMNRRDCETLSVPLFESTSDKGAVIERHLAMHCKCLDASHLRTIVNCKLSSRPLFLTVLANELRVCGTFDNLPDLLKRYVKASSFRDLWKSIISRWTKEYGWSTEGRLSASMSNFGQIDPFTGWVAETLRLLACSRHGLSETDILSLLKQMGYKGQSAVTSFDFALFRSAAFDALVERPGGLFGFFHQDLRDAVLNSLLGVIPGLTNDQTSSSGVGFLPQMLNGQMQQCHEHLADYFLHQPSSRRRVEELPYHLDRCGDVSGLNKVVTNPDTFLAMQADTSQNIALKLDLIHYCNRLSKENFSITTSLTKMVSQAVSKEDNPNQVKSASKVSFADDVGEMVMRSATRMDWGLPGFKKKLGKKNDSIGVQSDNFSSQLSNHAIDLTGGKQAGPPSTSFGSRDHPSTFSDFESIGSRNTVEKSTLESGGEEYVPGVDLTMSRATRTDLDSITGGDEAGPPPPPPLPPLSLGAFSGIDDGSRDGMESRISDVNSSRSWVESRRSEMSMGGQSRPDSRVEEVIVKEEFTALSACPVDMSVCGSNFSDVRSQKGSILDESEKAMNDRRGESRTGSSIPDDSELSRSLTSFAPGEQDMLDDLVNSLGDAFEISSNREESQDEEKIDTEKEVDEESEMEGEVLDENRIRCKSALLAMHVGKFLAEKSAFDQSEEMLMLAYDRIIDMFPLTYKEQLLLVEVQESIGDRHLFQLRKDEAKRFFGKALNSLEHIIEEETYDNIKPLLETKGRLLNRIGSMAVHDRRIEEAEEVLMEASQCMRQAKSVAGIATAQFNLGFLKIKVDDYRSAEACLLEALQTRERWYGSAHPLVAEVLNELAGLLCKYDNEISYDRMKAEAYYRRALKIRREALGKDHLLVATTLFHLGRLLRSDGSFQSKKEALELMSRALDIRTTKFGAHHKLTHAIRNTVKGLRKELDRGDYDRAPVKPPDKRTKDNPRSNLSWREQDLLSVGGRSGSPNRRASSFSGRNSPRSIDRSPSPRPGSRYGGSVRHGSVQYNMENKGGRGDGQGIRRDRAQSSQHLKYNGSSRSGSPQTRSSKNRKAHSAVAGTQQKDCRPSSSSSSSSSSSNKEPTLKAKYLYHGCLDTREDGVSFAEGHTVLGSSEMADETSSNNGSKEKSNQRQVNGRSYSSVSSSTWTRGPKSSVSEMSSTSRRRDIPSPYDSNIQGPNSHIASLLGDPPGPRSNTVEPLHDAAWYHGKGRYPKDQQDFYPPRRQQQRPNSHKLPLLNPTSQIRK